MKAYFLYTMFILFFGSCNSQDKAKVQFYFYPSSGGEAIYEVEYNDGRLKIKNNEVSNVIFRKNITKEEDDKIVEFTDRIKVSPKTTTDIILDSWRIELKINEKVYYNKSGVKIKDLPPDIRVLLNYLLKDSTVKIDLYDFS